MSTVDKETYYTPLQAANGSITYTYQLPPPSIHVYDTAAANWASISLPSNIRRLHNMGYAQSKRNKVGYMLGASSVVEQQDVWTNTLSAYDFKKNLFNTSGLSDDIDPMTDVVLHSLDRVGDEGVLIALAGMSHNIGGLVDYVSYSSCLSALSGCQTKSPNSPRTNIASRDTHLAAYG